MNNKYKPMVALLLLLSSSLALARDFNYKGYITYPELKFDFIADQNIKITQVTPLVQCFYNDSSVAPLFSLPVKNLTFAKEGNFKHYSLTTPEKNRSFGGGVYAAFNAYGDFVGGSTIFVNCHYGFNISYLNISNNESASQLYYIDNFNELGSKKQSAPYIFRIKYNSLTNTLAFLPKYFNDEPNMKLLKDYEKFTRNIRLGVTEIESDSVSVSSSKKGVLFGGALGYLLLGNVGGVAGVLLGEMSSHPKTFVTRNLEPISPPKFEGEGDDKVYSKYFSTDFALKQLVSQKYKDQLLAMKALTPKQIEGFQYLKKLYSPLLDKSINLILNTDYENQGICVRDGNCHLNLYLKALGDK